MPRKSRSNPVHTAEEMQAEIQEAFGEEKTEEAPPTTEETTTHSGHVINPGDLDDLPPSGRNKSMSMIDPTEWELDDSHEPITLKDGTEALLRVIEVTRGVSKLSGVVQYIVRFDVPSEPFSRDITDWFDEPTRGMEPKRLNDAKQKMKHFMDCFGIDRIRPSDPNEDWVGCEGWCILSLRSSEQYGDQNRIAKFVQAR